MLPLVTIIVPVYNAKKYLQQCIISVINQTYSNLEIIIVNDGSTDGSDKIIDNYAKLDKRIRVVHKKNEGVSIARNIGIQLSTGEYIQFLDSDDYLENIATEDLVSSIYKFKSDLVVCSFYLHNIKLNRRSIHNPLHRFNNNISVEDYLREFIEHKTIAYFGSNWNKIYSANLVKMNKINFKENVSFAEDLEFNLDYLINIQNIYLISTPLLNYRVDSINSLSKSYKEWNILWKRYKLLYHKFVLLFEEHECYNKYKIKINDFLLNGLVSSLKSIYHKNSNIKLKDKYFLTKKLLSDNDIKRRLKSTETKNIICVATLFLSKSRSALLLLLLYTFISFRESLQRNS